ncbi:hypothetical protein HK405_012798, partial [Cladochytrium tenue]
GLAAGIAAYIKRVCSAVRIVGIETYDADAMTRSLRACHRVELAEVGLFADSAAVRSVGVETFRVCSELVDAMVLVSTDEICAVIKDIFENTRSVVEPADVLGVAGGKKHICSGANMNFTQLPFVADRADLGEEREALLLVRIPERPGSFLQLYRSVHPPGTVTEFADRFAGSDEAVVFMGFQRRGGHCRPAEDGDDRQGRVAR